MIDLYCERLAPGLLGEPLNTVSNVAFIVAGVLAWHASAQTAVRVLATLVILIGCGSFLFHATASAWAQWADVIPIAVFQVLYLALYLRALAGQTLVTSTTVVAFYVVMIALPGAFAPAAFDGSLAYLPALLVLSLLAADARRRHADSRLPLAVVLFALSLTARTLDLPLCAALPAGTHFLWHLANSAVLYLLVAEFARRSPSRPATAGADVA